MVTINITRDLKRSQNNPNIITLVIRTIEIPKYTPEKLKGQIQIRETANISPNKGKHF